MEQPHIPLRTFVPLLITTLEDPDASVRDTARETTIEMFSHPAVSPAARADLKKELARRNVRKSTTDAVIHAVLGGTSTPATEDAMSDAGSVRSTDDGSSSQATRPGFPNTRPKTVARSVIAGSSSALPVAAGDTESIEPYYVRSILSSAVAFNERILDRLLPRGTSNKSFKACFLFSKAGKQSRTGKNERTISQKFEVCNDHFFFAHSPAHYLHLVHGVFRHAQRRCTCPLS
jgi:hypothetical protein